ncbi:carbonic anhydrase domain-containing protein [Cyclospora cayetanensis]|nr:carbonic anhydrase domain-containing protein [Cyclospora cayetanensis]
MGSSKRHGKSGILAHLSTWFRGRSGSQEKETASEIQESAVKPCETKVEVGVDSSRKWDYKLQGADWAPVLACDISNKRQSPIEIDRVALETLLDRHSKGELTAEVITVPGNRAKIATADRFLVNKLGESSPITGKQVVFDCGYKLQLKPSEGGAFGQLEKGEGDEKEIYEPIQFHFHAPAEHTIGTRSCLELHIVCRCLKEGKQDQLLVLGLMFDAKGEEGKSMFLDECESALIASLSPEARAQLPERVNIALREAKSEMKDLLGHLNLKSLLPDGCILINYDGSLTTPPCTENVAWYVALDPLPVSPKQAKRFGSYLQSGEGNEARGNYRLRQNVEVKANEQTLHILVPCCPSKPNVAEQVRRDTAADESEGAQ